MKITKSIVCAAIAALVFTACSDSKKQQESAEEVSTNLAVDLHTYTYDELAINSADSVSPDSLKGWRFSGDCVLPSKIGNHDITALRDSLMALANITIDKTHKAIPNLPEGVTIPADSKVTARDISTSVNSLSIDLLTSTVIVWENYSYEYQIYMAHGISETKYVNYSIADNKILSLADLMKPGYEPKLLAMIHDQLKAEQTNLMVPLEEVPMPDIFRIRAASIEFLYPSTSIAPYSEGEIRVRLSIMDLEDILSPKGVQLILGTQSE